MRLVSLAAAGCAFLAASLPALAQSPSIVVESPWTRATPPGAAAAGAYLTIQNTGTTEDRLVGGTSPAAATVEIHEMAMTNDVMTMHHLHDGLAIPPGGSVTLMPSGHHVMLIGLSHDLVAGETVEATLTFEHAGEVPVIFSVQPLGTREFPNGGN